MRDSESSGWTVVTFPSRGMRREFLDHVRLWNRLEDLPPIETERMTDGTCVRFRLADAPTLNVLRLVDSLGGRVLAGRPGRRVAPAPSAA